MLLKRRKRAVIIDVSLNCAYFATVVTIKAAVLISAWVWEFFIFYFFCNETL